MQYTPAIPEPEDQCKGNSPPLLSIQGELVSFAHKKERIVMYVNVVVDDNNDQARNCVTTPSSNTNSALTSFQWVFIHCNLGDVLELKGSMW